MGQTSEEGVTPDAVALLLASMRDDREAVAVLMLQLDLPTARQVAVFCAYLAARQTLELERLGATPGHYSLAYQDVAMQLAVTGRGSLGKTRPDS